MTSNLTTQRERLAFIERQVDGNHWLFSGPEERAVFRELVALVKELHTNFTEFSKRFEEGEG